MLVHTLLAAFSIAVLGAAYQFSGRVMDGTSPTAAIAARWGSDAHHGDD